MKFIRDKIEWMRRSRFLLASIFLLSAGLFLLVSRSLKGPEIYAIKRVGSTVWIGTDRDVYRVEAGKPIRVLGERTHIVKEVGGIVWIGTDKGVYRVENGEAIRVLKEKVYTIEGEGGKVWIGTDSGVYLVEGGEISLILDRRQIKVTDEKVSYLAFFYSLFAVVMVFLLIIVWGKDSGHRDFEVERARKQMDELFPSKETFERPSIHIAHRRIQATTISGDFYNFIPRGDGSLGIYFVDVEGHGLSPSIQARSLYQALTDRGWGLGDARMELEKADELVGKGAIFQKEEAAFCMNFTEIDPERMEIRHANAGMPFPLLFRWGQAQPEPIQAAGVYVGAGYSLYPVKPDRAEVKVGDGDLLVIFSDGILEARDSRGRLFGQKGITATVSRTRHAPPEEIADEIIRAVKRHTGKEPPDDDQALVVVQIGEPVAETRLAEAKTLVEEKDGVFSVMNAGDTGAACHNELRERLKTWAQNQGFEEKRIHQVWSATWEAIQNAVIYGSKPGDMIQIRFVPPDEEGLLAVEVSQSLLWEDWDEYLGEGARRQVQTEQTLMGGTVVMLWLASEIRVTDLGRKMVMRFSPQVVPKRTVDVSDF